MAASQLDRSARRRGFDDEDEFAYASLVNRWRRERATTTLTKMDAGFYDAFDRHLKRLQEDYAREHAASPAAPKVLILLDELTSLQRVREDLFDLREKKIVTAAMIAARDGRPDRSHMTREEVALYESILAVLAEARRAALRHATAARADAAAPSTGGPPAPLEPAPPPAVAAQPATMMIASSAQAPSEPPLLQAEVPHMRAAAPPAERVAPEAPDVRRAMGAGRVLVRVTHAVEPFVAPDLRHYRLQAEDVAALPRDVAHVLVTRGVAVALGG